MNSTLKFSVCKSFTTKAQRNSIFDNIFSWLTAQPQRQSLSWQMLSTNRDSLSFPRQNPNRHKEACFSTQVEAVCGCHLLRYILPAPVLIDHVTKLLTTALHYDNQLIFFPYAAESITWVCYQWLCHLEVAVSLSRLVSSSFFFFQKQMS